MAYQGTQAPENRDTPAGQGQRATRLVWALTAVALGVGLAGGVVVHLSLEDVRNSTQSLHAFEQRADASLRELQRCVDQAREEFEERLEGTPPAGSPQSVTELKALAPRLQVLFPRGAGAARPDPGLPVLAGL